MAPTPASALPVEAVLPELLAALADRGVAVLQAPPGSGKTTRVPLVLLGAPWLAGRRVLVLEPRRVAARAAARRMAVMLGEELGRRVGYHIRQERVGGAGTRIEVVTEGILTRMLQADPSLADAGAVIFDEFHERSVAADVALALSLDVRSALRPDLRLLVMSATFETEPVARLLDDAPVITASAAAYPVTTVWVGRPAGRIEAAVATAVARALVESQGDVLVFLPGAAEIRAVERTLGRNRDPAIFDDVDVVTLHGSLSGPAQDAALGAAQPGRRKVILATSIAETSLTIDGVRVVVDSGLMRSPRFDPASGMTRLVTLPVSRASADQRQGRAARQGPGTCYRLWAAAEHAGLPRAAPPEILVTDLAPVALDLAEWGVDDPATLRWLDPPPPGPYGAARQELAGLGAIADGRITVHGRALARLGVHPRLANLLLRAAEAEASARGTLRLAGEIAAILSEGDPERGGDGVGADLSSRIDAIRRGHAPRLAEAAQRWTRILRPRSRRGKPVPADSVLPEEAVAPEDIGRLVALAYPERVGRQRPGRPGHWLLRNGRGAWVPPTDPLATAAWIVAAELDGDRGEARIWLGAPLHPDDVETLFGAEMTTQERVGWDDRAADVVNHSERRLGAIVVSTGPRRSFPDGRITAGLIEGIRSLGLDILPWSAATERLRARVAFARRIDGDRWPDLSDGALVDDLETWLGPWLEGRFRRADLAGLPLADALWQRLGWERRAELDDLVPAELRVPSGQQRRLEYPADGPPWMEVRLQELFGTTTTPTVAHGRMPVQLHLMSPAGRPVQVTSDLASFWANTYPQVRGELRARYPRHSWPEDPIRAVPTHRVAPRRPD